MQIMLVSILLLFNSTLVIGKNIEHLFASNWQVAMDHKMHHVQTLQVLIALAVAVIFSAQTTCAQAPSQSGVTL